MHEVNRRIGNIDTCLVLPPVVPILLRRYDLKQYNAVTESANIDRIRNDVCVHIRHQVLGPNRIEIPKVDIGRVLNVYHMFLTGVHSQTSRTPILEETVESSTILKYAGAVDNAKTPGFGTICRRACRGEVRIGICRVRCEGNFSVWIGLVVCRLMLYHTHEDV